MSLEENPFSFSRFLPRTSMELGGSHRRRQAQVEANAVASLTIAMSALTLAIVAYLISAHAGQPLPGGGGGHFLMK